MGFVDSGGEDQVMIKFGEGMRPGVVHAWIEFSSMVGQSSWVDLSVEF